MPLSMVAWEGYDKILDAMGVRPTEVTLELCPDGTTVLERFLRGGGYDLVSLDREHLTRVSKKLMPLASLAKELAPDCVLATALPRLAAAEYYGDREEFFMLPVRFGMNGVVYDTKAKLWLKKVGCLRWNPASVTEVVDLVSLLEALGKAETGGPRIYRWAFDAPVRLMLRRNLRAWSFPEGTKTFDEMWSILKRVEALRSPQEIIDTLVHTEGVVVIGPGDNVCGPARLAREEIEWTVAQGAGLLWLEGIAVRDRGVATQRIAVANLLGKVTQQLVTRGFECCCNALGGTNYWGLPVLGWRGMLQQSARRKSLDYMKLLGYEERVEGFWRLPPEAALGQFLDGAGLNGIGIALRGFPSPWDRRAFEDSIAERIYPDEATARRILEVQGERLSYTQREGGVVEGLGAWAGSLWAEASVGSPGEPIVRNEIFQNQRYRWAVFHTSGGDLGAVEEGAWLKEAVEWVLAYEGWRRLVGRGGGTDRLKAWLRLAYAQSILMATSTPHGLGREEVEEFLSEFKGLGRELGDRAEDLARSVRREELEKFVEEGLALGGQMHLIWVCAGVLVKKVFGSGVIDDHACEDCLQKSEDVGGLFDSWTVERRLAESFERGQLGSIRK